MIVKNYPTNTLFEKNNILLVNKTETSETNSGQQMATLSEGYAALSEDKYFLNWFGFVPQKFPAIMGEPK